MSISVNDVYVVRSEVLMGDTDKKVLNYLYQPLIGVNTIGIYNTLWNELDHYTLQGKKRDILKLTKTLRVTTQELTEGLKKIESVGLLRTYLKESAGMRYFVFDLYPPLSPEGFMEDDILRSFLKSELSEEHFEETISLFRKKLFNRKNYTEVTHSFTDIYGSFNPEEVNVKKNVLIGERNINVPVISNKSFVPEVFMTLVKDIVAPAECFNEELLKTILNIAYVYDYNEKDMMGILSVAVEGNKIDIERLRELARETYQLKRSSRGPKITEKKEVQNKNNDESLSKLERGFLETTPYQRFKGYFKGGEPPAVDLKVFEEVLLDIKLEPEVLNVLMDYIMYSNDGKFHRKFVHKIASEWKRLGIENVRQAIERAKIEYNNMKEYRKKQEEITKREKGEDLPEWTQQAPKEIATEEELARRKEEIEKMLED